MARYVSTNTVCLFIRELFLLFDGKFYEHVAIPEYITLPECITKGLNDKNDKYATIV